MTCASSRDKRLGGIDGRHGVRPYPRDELGRQSAGPTTDVEYPLTAGNTGQIGKLR